MKKTISFSDFKKLDIMKKNQSNRKLNPVNMIKIESSKSNIKITINEPPTPTTNIEKVVEFLNEIIEEFDIKKDTTMRNKASYVMNEIISHKMYNYEPSTSKEHMNFFQLYSSNIEDSIISNKKEEDKLCLKENKPNFTLINIEEFGVEFDVFSYAEKVGRLNMLKQVSISAFAYKGLMQLLKTEYLENYLEEIRQGYTSEEHAYYHNVSILKIKY